MASRNRGQRLMTSAPPNYDLLYSLLDLVTTLDPRFNIAYRFGAIFLAEPFPAGAELTARIVCRSPWGQHAPGCLRAAVLNDPVLADDVARVAGAQELRARNNAFTWWDTTYCPRVALLDSEGRAVACENKPRLGLTPSTLAERVKALRAVRERRDALWTRAEAVQGPDQAELLRQSLDLRGACPADARHQCVDGRVNRPAQRDRRSGLPDHDVFDRIAKSGHILRVIGYEL